MGAGFLEWQGKAERGRGRRPIHRKSSTDLPAVIDPTPSIARAAKQALSGHGARGGTLTHTLATNRHSSHPRKLLMVQANKQGLIESPPQQVCAALRSFATLEVSTE